MGLKSPYIDMMRWNRNVRCSCTGREISARSLPRDTSMTVIERSCFGEEVFEVVQILVVSFRDLHTKGGK